MARSSAAAMTAYHLQNNAERAKRVNAAVERRRQETLAKLSPEARAKVLSKEEADKLEHEQRMEKIRQQMNRGRTWPKAKGWN